jgi:hypothetical protein
MPNDAFESGAIASARNPIAPVKNLAVLEREVDPFEPGELLRICAVYEDQQRALCILSALSGPCPAEALALNRLRSRFVFCGPMGRPMLERSAGDHPWRRAIARAGVAYRVLCNPRQTYTTLMIQAGKPLQ